MSLLSLLRKGPGPSYRTHLIPFIQECFKSSSFEIDPVVQAANFGNRQCLVHYVSIDPVILGKMRIWKDRHIDRQRKICDKKDSRTQYLISQNIKRSLNFNVTNEWNGVSTVLIDIS